LSLALDPGTHLGPYEIQSALGVGGMGEVYMALDTRLDRAVAIKVLRAHLADDPHRRARFEREARLISQLNHPHICTLYDVGHDTGTEYLVVEYLQGQTLAERLRKGPLPLAQSLELAIQIAGALDAAHRQGIVHRDLKPANVMQTKSGAKLLDFGIARMTMASPIAADRAAGPTLTAEGTLLGTPHYMAPEQLEGRDADARSDVFAFGATLYEMLTGRRAFPGESPAKVAAAVLESEPPPIATTQGLTPPALEHLVRTCLAKDPDERWQSASDVKRQLEWIAASAPSAAEPMIRESPSGSRGRFRRNTAIVAILMALVLGSLVAWALWKRQFPASVVGRETRLEISTPATTTTSRLSPLAISPDGLTVAFVADSDGRSVLWLRPLSGVARPVDGTVGAALPFWSPDSQSIGFFADGKLKRIEVRGGAAQVLADALDPHGGAWSRDGSIIFTPHQLSPLLRVAAAGGAPVAVTRLAAGHTGHLYPQVLSDGAHVLYYAEGVAGAQGVYVSRLDGTAPKRLLEKSSAAVYLATGYVLFVREDVLLAQALDPARLELKGDAVAIADHVAMRSANAPAASASNNGDIVYRGVPTGSARQLTWLDRSGKTVSLVGSPDSARRGGLLSLSPDGRRIAVNRRLGDTSDLWLVDLDRSGVMSRLTFGGKEASPLWSRDGRHVAYTSTRNGVMDLYEASVDGGHDEPLLCDVREKKRSRLVAGWARPALLECRFESGHGSEHPPRHLGVASWCRAEAVSVGPIAV
jgi:serine/threonine protein kinase/Tol biopolymer transport system component